ncbi:MAG: hypothetical protein D3906_11240, partial [Candidatus Electrothrix sp. AUS1_2]|nr:hypothetical protein [Candidatus Electrothrix sp. AUS1_2]
LGVLGGCLVLAVLCLPFSGWAAQVGTIMPTSLSNISGNIVKPSVVAPQPQRYNSGIGNASFGSSITIPSFKPAMPPAQQPDVEPDIDLFAPSPSDLSSAGKANFLPPPVETGLAAGGAYTVGPADVLTIEVFDNPDLKGEYTVSERGDIVFPLVGQVTVTGKTPDTIKADLTRLLEKDYLYNPIVSVDVSKYLSKPVKIMGNVDKPGEYYLEGPMRLCDLLSKAGGVAKQTGGTIMSGQKAHLVRAAPDDAFVTSPDKTITYYVDLYQLLVEGRDELNVYLQSGDVIFIPDTDTIHVIGEVKKPGAFPFEEGLTLLKAIALAGGLTEKGSSENAVIKRMQNGRVVEIRANMDTLLSADDTVYIPENLDSFQVIGEVKNSGSFPFKEGTTLLKAIALAGGLTEKGSSENAVIKRMRNGRVVETRANMDTLLSVDDTVYIPENLDSFQVMGEVKNPGSFRFKEGTSLLKAIALAGGLTEKAAADDAVIKRVQYGRTVEMRASMDTLLAPNDTVSIPEDKKFIHVVGEVKHADSFPYEKGITLLNAINYAGGATLEGSPEDAVIKRLTNGRTIEMKGGVDTVLQPGDTVFVPKARSVEVVGEVKN